MSHIATNWAFKQRGLKPATKIILYALADRHNPDYGCFPKQKTLAYDCEMSRSTVNIHLNKLEELGLIERKQIIDPDTKKQRPTRYILGFELTIKAVSENKTRTPHIDNGSLDVVFPCPKLGHRAVSKKQQKPCPNFDKTRVLISDSNNPVKEPVSKKINKKDLTPDQFVEIWEQYPKKVDKKNALKAWNAKTKIHNSQMIIEKLFAYIKARENEDQQYTKNLASWLNGECWSDQIFIGTPNGNHRKKLEQEVITHAAINSVVKGGM